MRLLDPSQAASNKSKWVVIYGAATSIGRQAALIFARHGYSLVLIDSNLSKLQALKEHIARNYFFVGRAMTSEQSGEELVEGALRRVEVLALNFSVYKDSTSIEYAIRDALQFEQRDFRVFVNCISFLSAWEVCEDKLFHELQFDQIFQYTNNCVTGFAVIFNMFCRIFMG
mmetsp:Transcript_29885/g.22147  ORF Transcript_29885/g.22147 Transcript_29885/m.22147 type:complete len:171 (-) Transcript_29885:264-776(-)